MSSASEMDEPDDKPDRIMSYETKGGVVWYEFKNPCAWIKTEDVVDLQENV